MPGITQLRANETGVVYQNDSPVTVLVTVQIQAFQGAVNQPAIFNTTANPADQAVVSAGSTGFRTYLLAPQQGIQVSAPNGGIIGMDVLIAPST